MKSSNTMLAFVVAAVASAIAGVALVVVFANVPRKGTFNKTKRVTNGMCETSGNAKRFRTINIQ